MVTIATKSPCRIANLVSHPFEKACMPASNIHGFKKCYASRESDEEVSNVAVSICGS